MNIGQLLQTMLQTQKKGEPNILELKVGQVVKGLVLKLLSEQDALINIAGVQTKARLEIPLKPGEVTNFQVQPDSNGSLLVLKPVSLPASQDASQTIHDLLHTLSLKDTKDNRMILGKMLQFEIPVTKENVLRLAQILDNRPQSVPADSWVESAMVATAKNIPVSHETVQALHQVLYGDDLHVLLDRLTAALNDEPANAGRLSQATEANTSKNPLQSLPSEPVVEAPAKPLVVQLRQLVQKLEQATEHILFSTVADQAEDLPPARLPNEQVLKGAEQAQARAALSPEQVASDRLSGIDVQADQMPKSHSKPFVSGPSASRDGLSSKPLEDAGFNPLPENEGKQSNWISQALRFLGLDHEADIKKWLQGQEAPNRMNAMPADASLGPKSAGDDLKGTLMQLISHDDIAQPVKDAAQQVIQHITGQQLMLAADRQMPLSHVTLFIPIRNGQGEQTASVHIQARRGRKGELDARNCRLLFDLQLSTIGDTLVDVSVVDRMVGIQVLNDHPMIQGLVERSKAEITQALAGIGYRCVTIKSQSFPSPNPTEASGDEADAVKTAAPFRTYKGVDLRI